MATAPSRGTDLMTLWRAIQQAGGVQNYIDQQLRERGFLVERRSTSSMSKRQLDQYKKQLKAEAAERRNLRKTTWAAWKASHIVHLGDGVFWNDESDFDRWDLTDAENRAQENELPRLDKPDQLAEALGLELGRLRWLAFHRDAATHVHYARFTIPKRNGGERPIWAPKPTLKAAQRWIAREIVEHLPVHGAAHGFLPGRSILTNAQAHVGAKVVVKMDLKDFFPTLTLPRVKGMFRKAGYRDQIATLLALICTESPREVVEHEGKTLYIAMGPRCLPQGAPTSPSITNAICLRLDRRLAGLARKLGWRYTRYADDLTFSLPADHKGAPRIGHLMGGVKHITAAEGFSVHPDKTRVARAGGRQQVTGLVINGGGAPRTPRKLKRWLRAAIYNREQALAKGEPMPEGESLSQLAGYAAFVHMTDPELGAAMLERIGKLDGGS